MTFSNIADVLLWTGTAGAVGFVAAMLMDGWTRPGYSPIRHPVSALALGRRGWVQIVNFAVSGAAITAGGVGLLMHGAGVLLGVTVLVFGGGLIASAFPMDPMRGYPPGTEEGDPTEFSAHHRIHDYAGAVVFFSLPIAALIAAFTLPVWWEKLNAGAMAAILGVTSYFFGIAWEKDSPRTGLIQRTFIVPGWLWLASVFAAQGLR